MKLITLFLTCADISEAQKITQELLASQLVACVKQTVVDSSFFWKGEVQSSSEVLLIMDSIEDRFEEIEKTVAKLHSYDQFVLTAMPVIKGSSGVVEWVSESVDQDFSE